MVKNKNTNEDHMCCVAVHALMNFENFATLTNFKFHLNLRLKVKKSGEHLQEEKSTRASDSVCV